MKKVSFLLICFFSLGIVQSQDIQFWSDVMRNANNPEHRSLAAEKFESAFELELQKGNAFKYNFEKLPELSIVMPPDSSFKLISWEISKGIDQFNYFGFIIDSTGFISKLEDKARQLDDLEYIQMSPDLWNGGIYYGIHQIEDKYFVFSYRQMDKFTKQKTFDVIYRGKDDEWIFGGEFFAIPQEGRRPILKNRIVFSYSADALLSLNYNEGLEMVINDHLMPVMGRMEGQGPTNVPDGTYEGYKYVEGKWEYVEKIFDHVYEEAPRPKPVLKDKSKNIFGKEKKN